jgi:hypothetical protein
VESPFFTSFAGAQQLDDTRLEHSVYVLPIGALFPNGAKSRGIMFQSLTSSSD